MLAYNYIHANLGAFFKIAHKDFYSISFKFRCFDFWLFEDIISTKGKWEEPRKPLQGTR